MDETKHTYVVSTDKASTSITKKGLFQAVAVSSYASIHKSNHLSLLGSREKTWNSEALCRVHMPPAADQWTRELGSPGDTYFKSFATQVVHEPNNH